jgi:beta-lactamase regulating signal transducer with metallopeptidase domain/outer membrane protein assembly factor BamB
MLTDSGNAIGQLLWTQVWQVAVTALAIGLAAHFLYRKRPHLAYVLWLAVLIKCVTPPLWSSPTGVFSWSTAVFHSETASEHVKSASPAHESTPMTATENSLSEEQTAIGVLPLVDSDIADFEQVDPTRESAPLRTVTSRRASFSLLPIIGIAWFVGAATYAGLILFHALRCWRILCNASVRADESVVARFAKLARRLGIRRSVRLVIVDEPLGPLTFGVIRPLVVAQQALIESLSAESLEPLLAHELIHVRRNDALVGLLQVVVECLWWFHPLVWWTNRRIAYTREQCCDEEAVTGLGCEPGRYARSLMAVLEMNHQLRWLAAVPGIRRYEIIKQRLTHIMVNSGRFQRRTPRVHWLALAVVVLVCVPGANLPVSGQVAVADPEPQVPTTASRDASSPSVGDWPEWLGSPLKNNVSPGRNVPTDWDVATAENILWTAQLGSQTYGTPAVAGGRVFIGTNNGAAYVKRWPATVDLCCLLCFDERTGKFLWQHSNEKLAAGRGVDDKHMGIRGTPLVQGNRLWYVSNRCEVICLDTEGFADGENDGPYRDEMNENQDEADVVWKFDMIQEFGVMPRNSVCSSVTVVGEKLFLNTSNGVPRWQKKEGLNAEAASFIALDKRTGKLIWTDNRPGANILTGQWSSPAAGTLGGVEQVIFAGGDGWLYSFDPRGENGQSKLLWKFDCNPKDSVFMLERATRNSIVATPMIYDGKIYVTVGQDPTHGEGPGHLWCIDPTRRGDVSSELVFNKEAPDTPVPSRRLQASNSKAGDFVRPNPNSAVIWHYTGDNSNKFDRTFHRTLGSATIKNDLLLIADNSGLLHCLDAKSGKLHWTHDTLSSVWSTPLIVEDRVYIADLDGDVVVLKLSNQKTVISEQNVRQPIYATPIVANNVLYITGQNRLFAIGAKTATPR